jgi:hypothetical protein
LRLLFVVLFSLASIQVLADDNRDLKRGGYIETSVDATDKEGFECGMSVGENYLLYQLPIFFSTEFGKAGLLRKEHVGQYKLALVIDFNSKITGYKLDPNTKEDSLLVKTILNLESLPALNETNSCIAGKPFIFKFTIENKT